MVLKVINEAIKLVLKIYYRKTTGLKGENMTINGRIFVKNPKRIKIGKNCVFNDAVVLNGRGGINIGDNCHISTGAKLHTGYLNKNREHRAGSINIGKNVWVASGAVISHDVVIGDNCNIYANSVVTHNIPKNSNVAGIPARIIK